MLIFDFRGNGDSDDGPQSLAHYEQRDLEAAIDFAAARRPDAEIDVVGYSMGAAVALLVAARERRVAKVVADSSFADMHGVITAAARGLRLPPVPLVGFVDHATRLRYGYRFGEVQPVDVIARIAPRPLLLIHGTGDTKIPVEHAHRLADAAGEASRPAARRHRALRCLLLRPARIHRRSCAVSLLRKAEARARQRNVAIRSIPLLRSPGTFT